MKGEPKDMHELIKRLQKSIISDIDINNTEQIRTSLPANLQSLINKWFIPEIIEMEMPESDEEVKERTRYALSLEIDRRIDQMPGFYIPKGKIEFTSFERLSIPAFIGAVIFGLVFNYALGSFFKEALYAALIGMPIGASLFVWLFSKAIRHPLVTKMIKWMSVASLAFISIGAVFSGLRKTILFKPRFSFLQWLWLAILTVLIFWTLHLFKPRMVENVEERERCLETQLDILLYDVHEMCKGLIKIAQKVPLSEAGTFQNRSSKNIFLENSQRMAPSIQQMSYAINKRDKEAALLSVNSFLNSMHTLGIHELKRDKVFEFTQSDSDYFDMFGIINEGDMVEQLYSAWVDDQEKCVFKGKVKKVK